MRDAQAFSPRGPLGARIRITEAARRADSDDRAPPPGIRQVDTGRTTQRLWTPAGTNIVGANGLAVATVVIPPDGILLDPTPPSPTPRAVPLLW